MCIDALMCYKMCFKCVKNKRMDCVNGLGCPMVQSGVSSHRIPFWDLFSTWKDFSTCISIDDWLKVM